MKTILKTIDDHGVIYPALAFVCPGCKEFGHTGVNMLAVNTKVHSPSWDWNGDLVKPTLSPSIKSTVGPSMVCHSFLKDGVFEFLPDCTHSLANQHIELPDIYDWLVNS